MNEIYDYIVKSLNSIEAKNCTFFASCGIKDGVPFGTIFDSLTGVPLNLSGSLGYFNNQLSIAIKALLEANYLISMNSKSMIDVEFTVTKSKAVNIIEYDVLDRLLGGLDEHPHLDRCIDIINQDILDNLDLGNELSFDWSLDKQRLYLNQTQIASACNKSNVKHLSKQLVNYLRNQKYVVIPNWFGYGFKVVL